VRGHGLNFSLWEKWHHPGYVANAGGEDFIGEKKRRKKLPFLVSEESLGGVRGDSDCHLRSYYQEKKGLPRAQGKG